MQDRLGVERIKKESDKGLDTESTAGEVRDEQVAKEEAPEREAAEKPREKRHAKNDEK